MSRKFLFTSLDHFKDCEILNQTVIIGGGSDDGHLGEGEEDLDEEDER